MGKRTWQRRKITERKAAIDAEALLSTIDQAEPDPGFFFTELDPDPEAMRDEAPAVMNFKPKTGES